MLWHFAGWTQTLTIFRDGEPARASERASEVNDNLAALKAKIEALEQDLEALTPLQHPDRYYPNWRFYPDFYLTLPAMAGSWAGAFVRRAPDIDAQHKAEGLAGVVSPNEPSHR